MDLTRHCTLCDHQQKNLSIGTTCGLTNRKPEFNKSCFKIELNQKFEDQLKDVNIRYRKLQKNQLLTYIYFSVFILIGIAVISGGYFIGKYAYESRVISTVPLIIMGVGLGPLGLAIGTLTKHLQELKLAKNKKARLDEVLDCYGITYSLAIDFGKEYHGNQEVYVDLKINGVRSYLKLVFHKPP